MAVAIQKSSQSRTEWAEAQVRLHGITADIEDEYSNAVSPVKVRGHRRR